MDLLKPEQVAQITEAAAAASSEPREALRSFGERLRDLRNENPHASEADLREAVKGAVQAMLAKSRGQRRRADTQRVGAESDTPRDVAGIPGPPSGRMLLGAESEVEQMHNYISCIRCNLHEAIRNRENRWSRRDCTEYQEEQDWVMRTFRRVYDEIDIASMPVKMRRVARARLD